MTAAAALLAPDPPIAAPGAAVPSGLLPEGAGELRPAVPGDAEAMAALVNGYAALGRMLPKTPADLVRHIREHVVVVEPDGRVVACGGLRLYTPRLGEVVALAVAGERHGHGLGAAVVSRLLAEASAFGLDAVFAMTLEPGFFHRRGFHTTSLVHVPEKVAADCRGCARRAGCAEIAVARPLTAAGAQLVPPLHAEPREASGPARRLRVLPRRD